MDSSTASMSRPKNADTHDLQAYAEVDRKGGSREIQQHIHKHPMMEYDLDKEKLALVEVWLPIFKLPFFILFPFCLK